MCCPPIRPTSSGWRPPCSGSRTRCGSARSASTSETLEDLVLAAIHNASEAVREMTEEKMGPLTSGLGGLGGGLGLPGF